MKAEVPWFPCWGIKLDKNRKDNSEFIKKFLNVRPDNRWLLLSKYAAASERHLWSAWYLMEENFNQNTSLSNNPDAEFLRVISGTNQLKTAFVRGGINDTDNQSWLIYLPIQEQDSNELPELLREELIEKVQKIIYRINATLIPERPKPSKNGIDRLEINYEGNFDLINEDLFISHMAKSSLST